MQTKFDQELLQTQLEIQEQTLKNISQEIHDNIGQALSLAKLNLGTFDPIEDKSISTKIDDTKNLVGKAISDLRDLSRSMHGDRIAELGLKESIANELKILQNTGQFNTSLDIQGSYYKMDTQKEMVLFRIMQEALHNSIKHAKAKDITVIMEYGEKKFTLSVVDNGTGFDPQKLQSQEKGIGLKSMQNRAALIDGIFSIHSSNNKGTTISICLPV